MEGSRIQFKLNQPPNAEGQGRVRQFRNTTQPDQTFAQMIEKAVNTVDDAQKDAAQKVQDVVSGKSENIHEVMIAGQKASLSFQLMTEIRNRMIETYQELSRMQI